VLGAVKSSGPKLVSELTAKVSPFGPKGVRRTADLCHKPAASSDEPMKFKTIADPSNPSSPVDQIPSNDETRLSSARRSNPVPCLHPGAVFAPGNLAEL
jgi:hypothetical protein